MFIPDDIETESINVMPVLILDERVLRLGLKHEELACNVDAAFIAVRQFIHDNDMAVTEDEMLSMAEKALTEVLSSFKIMVRNADLLNAEEAKLLGSPAVDHVLSIRKREPTKTVVVVHFEPTLTVSDWLNTNQNSSVH